MQPNSMALKRKILYDNEEVPGLVETSELKDEEGIVDAPAFNRIFKIKNGVKTFEPLDLVYRIDRTTNTRQFFLDFFQNNETKDMTIINTDGTGREMDRWLCRDCECSLFSERTYNAAGVEFFGISVRISCSSEPIPLAG